MIPPLLLLLLLSAATPAPAITAGDLAALLSLRSTLSLRSRDWPRRADPCRSWSGVRCASDRVVSINISALHRTRLGRATPSFSIPGLANLTALSSFAAAHFPLPGPILSPLLPSSLTVLDLRNASVTGDIPPGLSSLANLTVLDLSSNRLVGALPDSLLTLPNLRFLDVSSNNLTGTLPDIPPRANAAGAAFNLSNNLYYGSVPYGVSRIFSSVDVSTNYFRGAAPPSADQLLFRGNCFNDATNQRSLGDCKGFYIERGLLFDDPSYRGKRSRPWKYVLAGVLGGAGVLALVILVIVVVCRMRSRAHDGEERGSGGNAVSPAEPPPRGAELKASLLVVGEAFKYEQLVQATSDFGGANFIKHGHSGDFYEGVLEGGLRVVVKRVDLCEIKSEVYMSELGVFAEASHVRLVPFLGQCLAGENEKFFVYKYMANGDLSSALYRKPLMEEDGLQSLDWITRLKIALGVTEALYFLHHGCTPPLVHRDVQASSILLDEKFEVRLGSLSGICIEEGNDHSNFFTRFLRLSQKSEQGFPGRGAPATCAYDVYCLGKVLLELVTGRLGISGSNSVETNECLDYILHHISIYEKDLITKIVDPSLVVYDDLLEEVWAMAIVAKACMNPKPSKRPLVRHILKALENPLQVVRKRSVPSSSMLRSVSSRGSWHGALLAGLPRSSLDMYTTSGPSKEDFSSKLSTVEKLQGSRGDRSFSRKRLSNDIYPEPFHLSHTEE